MQNNQSCDAVVRRHTATRSCAEQDVMTSHVHVHLHVAHGVSDISGMGVSLAEAPERKAKQVKNHNGMFPCFLNCHDKEPVVASNTKQDILRAR